MADWFGGQVSFEDRTKGLAILQRECKGKTVLDLGCAEGAISQWLLDAGAKHAYGIDSDPSRIETGQRTTQVDLHVYDFNQIDYLPLLPRYDIVLCLAILQKLRRPEELLDYAIGNCSEWLAIRTPTQVINDKRSDNRKLDVKEYVMSRGFEWLVMMTSPVWICVFRRVH